MANQKQNPDDIILTELHELSQQIGYNVRYEKGDFEGGNCLLKEQRLILINKKLEVRKKINILSKNLSEIGIENVYIKPALRDIIEEELIKK
jgi:hypothetical protein